MNKIYDLTGIMENEKIIIHASSNKGKEMIFHSPTIKDASNGDTILIDRPGARRVPFKVEGIRFFWRPTNWREDQREYTVAYVKLIDEHIGGYQKRLNLKFRKSK